MSEASDIVKRRKATADRRSVRVGLRLTVEDREALKAMAAAADLSVSELIRERLLG